MYPILAGIYKIESITQPIRVYIGSSVNIIRRQKEHNKALCKNNHPNPKLQAYYNKHGNDSLFFSIIEICDLSCLIEREQFYIDTLFPSFNLRLRAESNIGYKASEETKRKLSISNLGRRPSKEARLKNKIANSGGKNPMFGKKHKPESILKMKESKKGIFIGDKNPFYGKHHKKSSIDKMIAKKKGVHCSPTTEFKKGMKQDPCIIREKADKIKKPVIQLNLDGSFVNRWAGIIDITNAGFKHTPISYCCNNKKISYSGFIWMFESNYLLTHAS